MMLAVVVYKSYRNNKSSMEEYRNSLAVELATGEREEDERDPEDYDDYSSATYEE